ncbi:hypothetical protein F5X99DRAFT_63636 [Biscogniauxia marginata]|nr:hypothetical protein F5X99DRAFT_63636 [Biscogniauxia marginata]
MNETLLPSPTNSEDNSNEDDDAHLLRCWGIQDCSGCLLQPDCSWCPFSWTCVPNSHRVPMLAPAWDEDICPHWAERWEVRTRPLGCQVSTITTLTSLVTIVCTLVFILFVMLIVLAIRRLRDYERKHPGYWKVWKYNWRSQVSGLWKRMKSRLGKSDHDGEHDPLLPSSRYVDDAS